MLIKSGRIKYSHDEEIMSMSVKKDSTQLCSCKCHFGGAVSCPGCKDNHGVDCCDCKE